MFLRLSSSSLFRLMYPVASIRKVIVLMLAGSMFSSLANSA